MEALLALEDGRVFRGRSFGAAGERTGEVVFNTSMTGYQEVLTDPSYRGQIVVMTCPQIGNYGTNPGDGESSAPQVAGFVVREVSPAPSNWRSELDLPAYLDAHGVVGLDDIDTRALTRHIRTRGAMKAALSTSDSDPESLVRKARESTPIGDEDLVGRVSCGKPYDWNDGRDPAWGGGVSPAAGRRLRCLAFDFGIKHNILRLLHDAGFDVRVVPGSLAADAALGLRPDAVFLSNGPGDPATPAYAASTVEKLIGKVPIFGICLGHQVAALALGGRTFKLKFGHRGANHPVQDLRTRKVAVTSQNHGYAVDPESLPEGAEQTHVNLNDGTCEGFRHARLRLMAVQYHPEASPGPHDSLYLFREFRVMAAGAGEGS